MKRLLILLALSGCAMPQHTWREQRVMHQQQQQAAYVDRLTQVCQAYGFKPEAMAECRMKLDAIVSTQTPTLGQSIGRGLRAGGEVMRSEPSPTATCHTQTYPGWGTRTRCW